MSGFRIEIAMPESRWQIMTPAERQAMQAFVDEMYEPPMADMMRLDGGITDEEQISINSSTEGHELHNPTDKI